MTQPNRRNHENRRGKPRIVATVGTCSGEPRIKGTRMPVTAVLASLLGSYAGREGIRFYYPHLTHEQIEACVQYAVESVRRRTKR